MTLTSPCGLDLSTFIPSANPIISDETYQIGDGNRYIASWTNWSDMADLWGAAECGGSYEIKFYSSLEGTGVKTELVNWVEYYTDSNLKEFMKLEESSRAVGEYWIYYKVTYLSCLSTFCTTDFSSNHFKVTITTSICVVSSVDYPAGG